jgi:predicted ABC-type ATPase
VAGPNGSGKSSLINHLQEMGVDLGEYINADDIAKQIFGGSIVPDEISLRAQQTADQLREACLAQGKDFTFETVMSHESKVSFMQRARALGYAVQVYFIATGDPALNAERVAARVKAGGHAVPVDRIIARYHRTLGLLPAAIIAATRVTVFDNSAPAIEGQSLALRPVAEINAKTLGGKEVLLAKLVPPVPLWCLSHLRFAAFGYELKTGLSEILPGRYSVCWSKTNHISADADISAIKYLKDLLRET